MKDVLIDESRLKAKGERLKVKKKKINAAITDLLLKIFIYHLYSAIFTAHGADCFIRGFALCS